MRTRFSGQITPIIAILSCLAWVLAAPGTSIAQTDRQLGSIPGDRGELVLPLVPGPPTYTDPLEPEFGGDTAFEAGPRINPSCNYDARRYLASADPKAPAPLSRSKIYSGWLASQLIGNSVRDSSGAEIGEVHDILVGHRGRISALIVESGGFLGMGNELFRVPWRAVRSASFDRGLRLGITEEQARQGGVFNVRVPIGPREYRVSALRGDWTRIPIEGCSIWHGTVNDVIFSPSGRVLAIVEQRQERLGGGYFAYPFEGFDEGWRRAYGHYDLPKRRGAGRPGISLQLDHFANAAASFTGP